jgi:hypothetical protein
METYKTFNYKIAKVKCEDESIYKNQTLLTSLDMFFSNYDVHDRLQHSNGEVLSSFDVPNFSILTMPGIDKFIEWHNEKALSVSDYFGYPKATDIEFVNAWINKAFENASGDVHIHENTSHVVSVFCPVLPKSNSADLVIVNEGLDNSKLESYTSENLSQLDTKEGDCVFMNTGTPHGVTKHSNKDPIIGFVFEFKYIG